MSFRKLVLATALTAAASLPVAPSAMAAVATVAANASSTEFQARMRWGATGFEAAIVDPTPSQSNDPQINPTGTPFWAVGQAYRFEVGYAVATGTFTLKLDVNRDDAFGTGEVISRNAFIGTTSYAGKAFEYISISGNESGSTARSTMANIVINGSAQSSIAPAGTFAETFYGDTGGNLGDVTLTGTLTFNTSGTGQERPSWNIGFRSPVDSTAVPEPATLALLGAGLFGLALARRRRA